MAKTRSKEKKRQDRPAEPLSFQPNEKAVLAALVGLYVLTVVWGLLSESVWDDDCVGRYYNARYALQDPSQFINLWNRPLFILLFALPVQLGKQMIVFQMALISVLACYALYRAARLRNIPNAYLIIPFTAFQTFYFPISFNALAEPLAAAIFAFGILFYVQRRFVLFALVGSLLPLARLELSPLLAIWGIVLLHQKQWKIIPLLALPTLLWNFAGTYLEGDPLYLYNRTLGSDVSENRYGHTDFWSYFRRYIFVVGPVIFYFLVIGLFENIYRWKKRDWFITAQFLLGFMIYVVFSWKLNVGQAAGFLRHLIALSPFAAFLAVTGFNAWFSFGADRKQRNRVLAYSAVILVLTLLFFSRKLVIHHIVSAEPEYVKFAIISLLTLVFVIGAYLAPSAFENRARALFLSVVVVVTTMAYTLITEPPNASDNPERQLMAKISDWYVENDLQDRKTYANHIWFFYSNDLDFRGPNIEAVTQDNLDDAPESSIVIWESHYSHRLRGDVTLDYFKDNPKFQRVFQLVTPNRQFGAVVFQAVR